MKTRILITAATQKELEPITGLTLPDVEISLLVTGVGSVLTVWTMMDYLRHNKKVDYIINTGIAGSFLSEYPIGSVLLVRSDCFADLGIETKAGFKTAWEEGLINPSERPFINGRLIAEPDITGFLEDYFITVDAVTVNSASGTTETINRLIEKFNPAIETMESAAVLYTGALENIPVIVLRSVSNLIEPRNRDAWQIDKALLSLKPALQKLISKLTQL